MLLFAFDQLLSSDEGCLSHNVRQRSLRKGYASNLEDGLLREIGQHVARRHFDENIATQLLENCRRVIPAHTVRDVVSQIPSNFRGGSQRSRPYVADIDHSRRAQSNVLQRPAQRICDR